MSGDGQKHPRQAAPQDDQAIKEFAETAMNELLGLYGYGKVDSRDTLGLSLHRYTNHSPPRHTSPANHSPTRHGSSPTNQTPPRHASPTSHTPPRHTSPTRHQSPANQSPPRQSSPTNLVQPKLSPPPASVNHQSDPEHDGDSLDSEDMPVAGQSEQSVSPGKTEPGSSPGSTPKSDSGGLNSSSGGGGGASSGLVLCSWCSRVCGGGNGEEGGRGGGGGGGAAAGGGGAPFHLPTTSGDRHFCSEVCFTQCRRASFKKSKVCDWCRHVRPTVTYVDFTDGDHQLQFCSDKCLNQYKMQIFCRETEAHLQMHPHLHELKAATSSAASLITPDLWLRDCGLDTNNTEAQEEEAKSPRSPAPIPTDPTEPVNLSTSHTVRSSPAPPRLSTSPALPPQTRSPAPPPPTPRYGRPRLRDRRESGRGEVGRGRAGRGAVQPSRPALIDHEKLDDPPRPPAIRVRQLEAQPEVSISTEGSSEGVGGDREGDTSPIPAPQPPALPLGGLGGLLPMVGSAPLLLPHMLPPDLPRTPLLPHLLLQRPDLLRPPPLRHPLLPAPPAPAPPTPAPPAPAPPPQPAPPKTAGGLLPPVTVLLPCPIPIPIPIPVPIPIPIPPRSEPPEPRPAPPPRPRVTPRKDPGRPSSVINGAPTNPGPSTPAPPGPTPAPPPPQPPPAAASTDGTATRPDRERRSILRYTSDVYEINGVFLPRDSAWDAPEPLHLRRALTGDTTIDTTTTHSDPFPPREESRSPTPEQAQDSKEPLAALTRRDSEASTARQLLGDDEDTKVISPGQTSAGSTAGSTSRPAGGTGGGRKRPAAAHTHPLPKKKHLLV